MASSLVLVAAAIRLPSRVELSLDNARIYAAQVLRSLAALVKAAVTALAASLATERRTLARLIPVSLKGVCVGVSALHYIVIGDPRGVLSHFVAPP